MIAKRIVSLLATGTEMLYELGLGNRVVGISHECDYPAGIAGKPRLTRARIDDSACSADIDAQVKRSLAGGEGLYEIDSARLASLRPDIIITQSHCEVCAVSYDDLQDAIGKNPTLRDVQIVSLNPTTLEEILVGIHAVGAATGVAGRANTYVEKLRLRIERVRQATGLLPVEKRRRTACIEWIEPMMIGGNWMPELVELAGGKCGLAAAGQHSGYISWDDVRAFDPEIIVIMPCGFDIERAKGESAVLRRNAGWDDLSAVKNRRIFVVDGSAYFNRSGPRIVDSLELLAHLIHPDRMPIPDARFDIY